MERYRSWLALKQVPGVGNVLFRRLIDQFSCPDAVFSAEKESLLMIEGMTGPVAAGITSFRNFDRVDEELEKVQKAGASLLCLNDSAYPTLLLSTYDPPPILYVKGTWDDSASHTLAIVGSRKTTYYGRTVTEKLCRDLVRNGVTVVSGFARGIDGLAHRTVLSEGGKTIAVLGCGIDRIYPAEHKNLFDEMVDQGTIFTEFPMGALPEPHHFPQRNRVISGLSMGCIVVEAALKSGSLITARLALEQGREVFAVPGPILSETSTGPNQLIASGAKLVRGVDDILDELLPVLDKRAPAPSGERPALESDEEILYGILSSDPKHVDQVILESTKTSSTVSGLLLTLELKGMVKQLAGQYYVRI
ncbi:MAG: DNA-processing protein DprA [Nitrospiria bacterium]